MEEALTKHIRSIAVQLVSFSRNNHRTKPLWHTITDKSVSWVKRILKTFAFILCLMFSAYQVFERISYYLQYPVAVDVKTFSVEQIDIGSLTVCGQETDELRQASKKKNISSPVNMECANQLLYYLETDIVSNIDELWSIMNFSRTLISVTSTSTSFHKHRSDKNLMLGRSSFLKSRPYGVDIKNDLSLKVKWHEIILPFSTCLTISYEAGIPVEVKGTMTSQNPKGACPLSPNWMYFHANNTLPEARKGIPVFQGSISTIIVTGIERTGRPEQHFQISVDHRGDGNTEAQKCKSHTKNMLLYIFVDRPGNPCVNAQAYTHCVADCHQRVFSESIACRFPFMQEIKNKSPCPLSKETLQKYRKVCEITYGTDPYKDCKCIRPCRQTNWDFQPETIAKSPYVTVSTFEQDVKFTTFTERLDYDVTALFCDFGGILGLWLGISILSMFDELMAFIVHAMPRKANASNSKFKSTLYEKVKNAFEKERTLLVSVPRNTYKKFLVLKYMKYMVSCILLLGSTYLSVQRYKMFLEQPIKMEVHVEEMGFVQFPKLALCGKSVKLFTQVRKYVKKQLLPSKKICTFDIWDLLQPPKSDVSTVWNLTSVFREYGDDLGMVPKAAIGMEPIKDINRSEVSTPHGVCLQFVVGLQQFFGTQTVFAPVTMNENLDSKYCDRSYRTLYIAPVNGNFEITSIIHVPTDAATYIYFHLTVLKRLNLTHNPCSDSDTFYGCKRQCLLHELQNKLYCRLPFMPLASHPQMCSNSTSAKAANLMYTKITASLRCNCIRQCEEMIYVTKTHREPIGLPMTVNIFAYEYNLTPVICEALAYGFVKLISDIGSITGFFLALNMITVFNGLISTLPIFCSKIRKVFNRCSQHPLQFIKQFKK